MRLSQSTAVETASGMAAMNERAVRRLQAEAEFLYGWQRERCPEDFATLRIRCQERAAALALAARVLAHVEGVL